MQIGREEAKRGRFMWLVAAETSPRNVSGCCTFADCQYSGNSFARRPLML